MKKNTSQEAPQSTKRVWLALLIVGFLSLQLISAASDVLILSGESSTTGRSDIRGNLICPIVNGTTITAQIYPSTTATKAQIYFRTGVATGVTVENVSISSGNATFTTPLNNSACYYITANADGAGYTAGINATATGHYPRSNTQLNTSASVLFGSAEYTDQSEIWRYFFTSNSTSLAVTQLSPDNSYNSTIQTVSFVSNVTGSSTILNVSLKINGTINQTNTSAIQGVYNFTTVMPYGFWNWSVETYDTNGAKFTSSTRNFTISRAILNQQAYNPFALESTTQSFYANFTVTPGLTLSSANLTYNQTAYSASFTTVNSTAYNLSATLSTPVVSANTNITFNWTLYFTDGSSQTSSNFQQQVQDFSLDNCGSNTIMILNLTLKDEDNQNSLNATGDNTSIKVNLNLYPNGTKLTPTISFSAFYNQTLPARVCINNALGSSVFFMDGQIQYGASNYATEFYNIQNYSLNASSNPSQNITLYDLLSSRDQVFLITYRDSNFLPVSGALIQVGRLYVDEGITKTVEIPITDTQGQTVANLVLNTAVYTFTVTKNGQVLAVFTNQLAKCQNPLITTCSIELNSFSSSIAVTNFTAAADFLYTLTYNRATRVVSSTFVIPSGAVSTVLLNVTAADATSSFLCSQNVTTSSGTLTCTIPASFGNQTAYATLYKNGNMIAFGQVNNEQSPSNIYGGILIVIGIIIMLTLIGAAVSDNPVYTASFLIVGFGLLVAMNLVANNGFIGGLATILWLVVAIVIIAIKGGGRT